jgi:hypothetical protein
MIGIRRKFLVKTPFKWHTKFKLHRSDQYQVTKALILVKGIYSLVKKATFDTPENGHCQTALYSRYYDLEERYPVYITAYEYYGMLDCRKDKTLDLCITNYLFQYGRTSFNLDVYSNALKGLAILSQDHQQDRALPVFLDIEKEITGDQTYSNVALTSVRFPDDNND